jgi:hypothetical protein
MDSNHCGACGEVCKLGTCKDRVCATLQVLGHVGDADNIVTDAHSVAWLVRKPTESRFFFRPLAELAKGTTSSRALPGEYYDLAMTTREILFRDATQIYVWPTPYSGTPTKILSTGPGGSLVGFAARDVAGKTRIVHLSAAADGVKASAYRTVLEPSGELTKVELPIVALDGRTIIRSAIYETDAYFLLSDKGNDGHVLRIRNAFSDGAPVIENVALGQRAFGGISVDRVGVLWSVNELPPSGARVISAPPRAFPGEPFALLSGRPTDVFDAIESDETSIFAVSTASPGTILRFPRKGGAGLPVGNAGTTSTRMLLTPGYLFWLRNGNLVALPR